MKYFIYSLGQVTQNESIFTYGSGESVDTFSDPNHAPPFLDEMLSNLMGNSTLTAVCGTNVECLFDFAQTGDMEVGMAANGSWKMKQQQKCKNHVSKFFSYIFILYYICILLF